MQKFDTTAPISVVLDIPVGRIQIIAAEQAGATVEVLPANASKSRDVKAVGTTTTVYQDGVLRIENPVKNQYFGASGCLDVTLHVPAGSHIEAKSGGAELRTEGPLGDIAFDGAHGVVQVDEATSLRLAVHASDVTVGRLTGNGEIRVAKGDISITEAVRGTLTLRTESGSVTVGAAHGASATLDAGTTYGRVNNALNNTQGTAADLTIHATTNYGDITARSL
ncbi:DUF4097 family beta strand repeat-containing protein [Streptomyces violascens]|uniref:DUF4097 family beta strand repeat-containing protein n=1 Tax=Streptomyces violascens TaxID=67381 RepID=UPI003788EBC8